MGQRRPKSAPQEWVLMSADAAPAGGALNDSLELREHRLVGRDRELSAVQERLSGNAASVTCLVGPAGIGKTSLAGQVVRWAKASGMVVAATRCWDGPGTPALWPWEQLLEQLAISGEEPGAQLPRASDVDGDRFRQFDAVAAVLRDLASASPALLVVDDLHWSDVASLELAKFLARATHDEPLHLLLTYRGVEAATGPQAGLVADIEREALVVQLDGLHRDDLVDLLGTDSPAAVDPRVVDQLHERSGGNPFFALELARSMGPALVGGLVAMGEGGLPAGIRSAIAGHVAMASEPTRDVLTLAAVQGAVFDPRTVGAAAQLDDLELREMLYEAERAGLVRSVQDGQVAFVHALIGEALLAEQGPLDRGQAHLATADGMVKVFGADRPELAGSVTTHLREAGSLVPAQRLLGAALIAAHHAGEQLAWEDQSQHLVTAVGALERLPGVQPSQMVDVLIDSIEVKKRLRNLDGAHDLGLIAAAAARRAVDPVELARVALVFPPDSDGIEIDDIFDPAQLPLREEALAGLGDAHLEMRCRLQAAIALSLYWDTATGDRAESHQLSAERRDQLTASALDIARDLGDPATLAFALRARIYANWGPAMRSERPVLAEELIAVAYGLGDTAMALQGRVWRIAELLELGRLTDAEREVDAFEREAVRTRDRIQVWTAARWRANLEVMRGRLEDADRLALEAYELGAEIMEPAVAFHFYTTTIGALQYLRLDFGSAIEYIAQNVIDYPQVPAWRVGLAVAAAETGDTERAARELATTTASDFALLPRDLNYLSSMMFLSLACHHVGDAAVAKQIYRQLEPYAGRLAIHGSGYASYGAIDIALGETATVMGDLVSARSHYERAIEVLDPTGSPYAGIARVRIAELIGDADAGRATTLLEDAIVCFKHADLGERVVRAEAIIERIAQEQTVVLAELESGWTLQRGSEAAVSLSPLKGFKALRELVLHPHAELHALDLAAVIEGNVVAAPVEGSDALLDGEARAAYAARLTELGAQLDEADASGDAELSARLAGEFEAITEQLRAATFLGRSRRSSTNADRARVSVTKLVKRSVEHVREVDPDLGEHLALSITTGKTCVYSPVSPLHWRSA